MIKKCTLFILIVSLFLTQGIAQNNAKLSDLPFGLSTDEKLDYSLEHYWDGYDFKDVSTLGQKGVILDYVVLLSKASVESAKKSIKQTLVRASGDNLIFSLFVECYNRFLFGVDSRFMDYEKYLAVVEYITKSPDINELQKQKFIFPNRVVMTNRLGTKVTDFFFKQKNGDQGSLYEIKSEYIILFFNNPDCENCSLAKEKIVGSEILNNYIADRKLKIISIYPSKEIDHWSRLTYPRTWINGYDYEGKIIGDGLYIIRKYPCIYLLDKDKKVLLKETTVEKIEQYLLRSLSV